MSSTRTSIDTSPNSVPPGLHRESLPVLRCSVCEASYSDQTVSYTCPTDGGNLDVPLDHIKISQEWTPAQIASNPDRSIWRYHALMPVGLPSVDNNTLRTVGDSPFFQAKRLAQRLGLSHVWIKDDSQLPTASLKDRASAVVITYALELGIDKIITASTGNAGVALAGMAAAAGLEAIIVAPDSTPTVKLSQILIYGAKLVLVRGSYSDAFDLTVLAARQLGLYCRNTGFNPLTIEGKKTVAFEICEQFSRRHSHSTEQSWRAPDRVIVPVGDGNIIAALHKGFKDLMDLGWIDRIPKLTGVQAQGSAAIARAYQSGESQATPVLSNTIADSIAADRPSDSLRALRAARDTNGTYIVVTDDAILHAMSELARYSGVFAEPAAAASYAGLIQLANSDDGIQDEHIVLLITGSGLKDPAAVAQTINIGPSIEPTISELRDKVY